MSLKARLEAIRSAFAEKAPDEARAIMHRATADLRRAGLADRALGNGAAFPDFELEDSRGNTISSAGLLASGPIVLTIFRGHW